jgi:ubiquinone/menaquinone biosynthesis C-methylase UbiE
MSTAMPSPAAVYQAFTAYQRTAALRAAIELDLFTAVAEGAVTPAALAARCGAAERGVRILCDYLVVDGHLTKEADRYALTPSASMFLDRRSVAYLGGAVAFLTSPSVVEAFARLTEAVRRGGTALDGGGTVAPAHEAWVAFARAMGGVAGVTAELVAALLGVADAASRPWKVLDVAAGHGMFGITIARYHPRAEVTALDWPAVLAVAEENARAAGVADRLRLLPGDAFTVELGGGYDLALLPNFLHHFDPPTCERFLRRLHAALAPGGRAAIVEFVPNTDRVSPPDAAAFALVMLATTPAGDAFTYEEYERMLRAAGFARSTLHDLPFSPQRVIVAER